MRQADRDEIYNVIGHNNPWLFAAAVLDASGMGRGVVAAVGHVPVACMGYQPRHPGVCEVFAFGTNAFDRVALSLTKHALRVMKPAMLDAGFHRAQCLSRHDHVTAHRWLEHMGFKREGVLSQYGSDGSDYIQFGAITNVFQRTEAQEAPASTVEVGQPS